MDALRITEIFLSLQGETRSVGRPAVFIRLTGCPLRCGYCDSAYAFHGGELLSQQQVLAQVASHGCKLVVVTGGEPLAQKAAYPLMTSLCDAGHEVYLETSGALDVAAVDPRVIKVLDLKAPGSGESARNRWANLSHLNPADQIKFVLCDRADYDWAKAQMDAHALDRHCEILFSPVHGTLAPRDLADWIVQDRLPVRMQIQLHKLLWGDVPGR